MGYFRFSMMLAVMYYHIANIVVSGYLAVHGLFVLSGYVITLVSCEFYNHGWRGRKLFLLNRFYRIYPTYLACLVISLLCMWVTGFTTQALHRYYTLPVNPEHWIYQFTIIGLSNFTPERCPERLLPAAWSLSTELVYYLIIGLATGASRRLTLAAFWLSVTGAAYMQYSGFTFKYFYLTLYGPSYVFFAGAICYHYRHIVKRFTAEYPLWVLIVVANLLIYIPDFIEWPYQHPYMPLYFFGTAGLTWLVQCIEMSEPLSPKLKRIEVWLGSMTYPAFLLHWPMAALASYFIEDAHPYTLTLFGATLVLTLGVSAVIVRYIENPIKPLRKRIRQSAALLPV